MLRALFSPFGVVDNVRVCRVCMCVYVCMCVCTNVRCLQRVCMCVCACVYTYVRYMQCMRMCVYVFMCVHIHIVHTGAHSAGPSHGGTKGLCIHTYTHTHMHRYVSLYV